METSIPKLSFTSSPIQCLATTSEQEEDAINQLLESSKLLLLPQSDPSYSSELKWCNRECIQRYLKASKFDLQEASTLINFQSITFNKQIERQLNETLIWRREYKPDYISKEDLKYELAVGKVFLNGFDRHGRMILNLILRKGNSGDWERGLRHSINSMERAFQFMLDGQAKICIVVDFLDMKGGQPLSISRKWIDIMSKHYPERLGLALLVNTSWYVDAFLKIVFPFIDPVTKSKVVICKKRPVLADDEIPRISSHSVEYGKREDDILKYVDPEYLDVSIGGIFNFQFDCEVYMQHYCQVSHEITDSALELESSVSIIDK